MLTRRCCRPSILHVINVGAKNIHRRHFLLHVVLVRGDA
uniref:Uncharacterized protein n=1 Tax=Arundo donax TaxID=35708 RepID=A0A0A8ZY56_ARUDO